jgi:glucose/arabinose dehydrogenase
MRTAAVLGACTLFALAACSDDDIITNVITPTPKITCDANNAGLTLPAGFCALVVADLTMDGQPAQARHMVVTPNGDVFVAINTPTPTSANPSFGIIGLRDLDGDGRADQQTQFSPNLGGSGLAWGNGVLYFGANDRVVRFTLPDRALSPTGGPEVVVSGLPSTGDHISKTLVLANSQTLYVNLGSMTNSCQVANRQLESPGISPCPELPTRAGVWVFNPAGTNQTEADGRQYATGYRNMVALAVNPVNGALYGVMQGRDMLSDNWPQFFTADQSAVLPAEEFVRIADGSNNGWPYCYFDAVFEMKKVLAPEYGGDGKIVSGGTSPVDCSTVNQPLATFGAHFSPDGMSFYTGTQFPARFLGGMFVVFHGGFNRAPLPNEGFQVQFLPMAANGTPSGPAEVFADGFVGSSGPLPQSALHRPVGVAQGPDGSLYFSDDVGGRIYRVIFSGN